MELSSLRRHNAHVVECVDNDETAAVICELMHARYLVILTSTEGIYRDPADPGSLVRDVVYPDAERLMEAVRALQQGCVGASRPGPTGPRPSWSFPLRLRSRAPRSSLVTRNTASASCWAGACPIPESALSKDGAYRNGGRRDEGTRTEPGVL